MTEPRVRRSPDEARRLILDAAERLLAEEGVGAVQVRAVAGRVGMTDAGINYHFGTRDQLLEDLLRHCGRKVRAGVEDVLDGWLEHGADIPALVDALAALYRRGYGELAVALHAAGWRDRGTGMLAPLVDALHALRPDAVTAPLDDTRLAVAALHQALATDPLYGADFRRSAGIPSRAAAHPAPQLRWWATHLARTLGLRASPSHTAPPVRSSDHITCWDAYE